LKNKKQGWGWVKRFDFGNSGANARSRGNTTPLYL